jgi:hypothetical protein
MAKRRRSGTKSKQQKLPKLPKAAETIGFTEADEAFFSAGDSLAEAHTTAHEHEEESSQRERPSFWRRLFSPAA